MANGMIQVGSLVYAANGQNKAVDLAQQDPENEIRSYRLQLELTLISTAAAFAVQAGDHYTLVSAVLSRLKGSWNFDENALNATPDRLRHWNMDCSGGDTWVDDLGVGDLVPISTGAAIKVKIPVDVQFVHQADDAPNMLTMTTDQMNASAAKLLVDFGALPTNGGPVVLLGGTATVVVSDIKVLAEYGDAYGVRVGPHWTFRSFGEGKDRDLDTVAGVEHLLLQESDPKTFEGVFSQVQISIDGRARTRNQSPTTLAADYLRSSVKRDPRGYNITRNALGGVGAVTPLRWKKAHIRSAEYEQPFHNVERRIEFTPVAGAARAYSFFQVKTHHVSKVEDVTRRMQSAFGVGGSPASLEVHGMGGADNNSFAQFKGRILKRRGR